MARQRNAAPSELTPVRRQVLGILERRHAPVTAYEVLEELSRLLGRSVSPPTVYRGLAALRARGLIARIESRNAFLARGRVEDAAATLIYLCKRCGAAQVVADPAIEQRVAADASALRFRVEREVHEVEGLCHDCDAAPAPMVRRARGAHTP
jgi:Fur family zinc uptake transcriptional regulator